MNKTINIGEGTTGVDIRQTIIEDKPEGISVSGVSLTSGYGLGIDIGIILVIVATLYVAKKMVDKWIS